jgi:hypothetical protein
MSNVKPVPAPRARRRRTQAERSETMRRRILDAAVDVLAA